MISIPTDCPQRERVGWTGDMQVYAPTACYEADVEQFLRHWMRDVQNEQLEDGQVPHIVPCMPSHDIMKPAGIKGVSAAGWSDAAVIVPWRLYQAYGDIRILEENYELMSRYMKSTENCVAEIPDNFDELTPQRQAVQKYLWNTGFQYGDWLMPSIQMLSLIHIWIASYRVENHRFIPTFFSDGVMALSGHTRAEYEALIGDNALNIVYGQDRERVMEAAEAALSSGEVLDVSYRMRHKDGGLVWIHLNGRRMGPLSENTRFYAVFTGMSLETRLFQSIANEMADSIYIIAKDSYDLLYVNEPKKDGLTNRD